MPDDLSALGPLDVWRPAFPSASLVGFAASQVPAVQEPAGDLREGPRFEVSVGPGMVAVGARDWARRDRSWEGAERRRHAGIDAQTSDMSAARALVALVAARTLSARDAQERLALTGWSLDREALAEHIADVLDDVPEDTPAAVELADLAQRLEGPEGAGSGRVIRSFSRRSRARMVRRLCEYDYQPLVDRAEAGGLPGLVTCTYPGEWRSVATSGLVCNRQHWDPLRKRYARVWGDDAVGPWKRETQARGAPHYHWATVIPTGKATYEVTARTLALLLDPDDDTARLLGVQVVNRAERLVRSTFRGWLSIAWTEIVDHQDAREYRRHMRAGTNVHHGDGLRCRDPKRLAAYFAKEGLAVGKEYQNEATPEWLASGESLGRHWGAWGLERAVSTVQVTGDDAVHWGRTLRRHARAQRQARRAPRDRVEQATGRVRRRSSRSRVLYMRGRVRGWRSLNDGPATAARIAAWLDDGPPEPERPCPPIAEWSPEDRAARLAELRARRQERTPA